METVFRLTNAEVRLAELLWSNAPIASMEMIRLAEREFGWKKSVTFAILKSLASKGLARNEKSRMIMIRSRDEIVGKQSQSKSQSYRAPGGASGGCLPMFIVSCKPKRGRCH